MSVTGGALFNAFGGSVTVVSTGIGFTITSADLPKKACVNAAKGIGRGAQFSTRINAGTAIVGEVTSAAATTGCSTDDNTIAWTVSS
ncbi:type 4 pilus major pilin [Pseudomonas sp. JG-B]|uniref:type 4 pilus major pilin n=1 Tax=Pseudomonas sp. JG-B TaxID=2603214 RepID=UPI00129DAC65|nr:hypothetical protein [Pseudomonas sp. JG-B]